LLPLEEKGRGKRKEEQYTKEELGVVLSLSPGSVVEHSQGKERKRKKMRVCIQTGQDRRCCLRKWRGGASTSRSGRGRGGEKGRSATKEDHR